MVGAVNKNQESEALNLSSGSTMAVKHLQRWMPLKAAHQRNPNAEFWVFRVSSVCVNQIHSPHYRLRHIAALILQQPTLQHCSPIYVLSGTYDPKSFCFSIFFQINKMPGGGFKSLMGSSCHIAATQCNRQTVFYQSPNVQTCEFKRVRRQHA